jgi:hypothetical protein
MRIGDNVAARSILIGADISGKLKVKASVAGGGSTAPGTLYKLIFDDYGWTATTLFASTLAASTALTSTQVPYYLTFYLGIAEQAVTSKIATGVGKSTELFDFVIGGPTIFQSTLATGTTGQGIYITTAAAADVTGAKFRGYPWEFAVFRNCFSTLTNGYSTSPLVSTNIRRWGDLSTGTQAILLTGMPISQA